MKTCPSCAENIPPQAIVCPYCGISLNPNATSRATRAPGTSSAMSLTFIILGGVAAVMLVCGGIGAALLLPAVQQAREAARRSKCKNNLLQIGLALHNYHDTYGCFPPAYIADADGRPLHSWRVLILPYIDEAPLYNQYKFSEPWDGPNNSRLLASMPPVYACPSHAGPPGTTTAYVAVFGDDCIFQGAEATKMGDILDGSSNTLVVGETTGANIPWMKPEDVDVGKHPSIGDKSGLSSHHTGGAHFLSADGTVRFISQNINQKTLDALFTRAGGEQVGEF